MLDGWIDRQTDRNTYIYYQFIFHSPEEKRRKRTERKESKDDSKPVDPDVSDLTSLVR